MNNKEMTKEEIRKAQIRSNYKKLRDAGISSALASEYKTLKEDKIDKIIELWKKELENYAIR